MRAQKAELCAQSTHIQAPNACISIAQEWTLARAKAHASSATRHARASQGCAQAQAQARASSLRKSALMHAVETNVSPSLRKGIHAFSRDMGVIATGSPMFR